KPLFLPPLPEAERGRKTATTRFGVEEQGQVVPVLLPLPEAERGRGEGAWRSGPGNRSGRASTALQPRERGPTKAERLGLAHVSAHAQGGPRHAGPPAHPRDAPGAPRLGRRLG